MTIKKKIGILTLFLGVLFIVSGAFEYNKSRHPNACVLNFSKSLGGKASLAFKKTTQQTRNYGMAMIGAGAIFTFAGCALLRKTKK